MPTKHPVPLSATACRRKLRNTPWVVKARRISAEFPFKTFREAVRFANRVATIAERIGHHPNILIHDYRFVRVETYTHSTGGLSDLDVALALAIAKRRPERR